MITSLKKCIGLLSLTPTRNLLLVSSIWIVGALHPASGQSIYTSGFESPALQEGLPLSGQDGWVPADQLAPFFSSNAAIVTTAKPRQGNQTVRVQGADMVHSDFINEITGFYYDAIGSYRHPVNYDTGGSKTVRVSANVRVDGPQTANGNNFYSAGLSGRADTESGGASVGEMFISSDGHVYAVSGNDNVPTFLASVPVSLGQWHNLAVVAHFATHTSDFYVDDVLLITIAWDPTEVYSGVLLRGTLSAYTAPDSATDHKASYASSYDQFSIKVTGK